MLHICTRPLHLWLLNLSISLPSLPASWFHRGQLIEEKSLDRFPKAFDKPVVNCLYTIYLDSDTLTLKDNGHIWNAVSKSCLWVVCFCIFNSLLILYLIVFWDITFQIPIVRPYFSRLLFLSCGQGCKLLWS